MLINVHVIRDDCSVNSCVRVYVYALIRRFINWKLSSIKEAAVKEAGLALVLGKFNFFCI